MEIKKTESDTVTIYIGGDYNSAIAACREFCNENPLCVCVQRADYVYTFGMESGISATLINYARFPCTYRELVATANALGRFLMHKLGQGSFSIVDRKNSTFYSRRIDGVRHK